MKPVDVKLNSYIDSSKEINILNLKLVILSEYQNIEKFLQNIFTICSEDIFMIKKVKNNVPWIYY